MFLDRTITITLEPREDGGIRIYSDALPGLILSHSDPHKAMEALGPSLQMLTAYDATKRHRS